MGTKIRYIADEILVSLRQVEDDRVLTPVQVTYLIIISANRLKGLHIQKRSSGAFLKPFPEVPVFRAAGNTDGKIVKDRQFVYLPQEIFDFNGDKSIDYIAYTSDGGPNCPPRFTQLTFNRTTPKITHRLYMTEYEKPSPSNAYFYRMGDLVYFLGTEEINLETVEMGLYTTIPTIDKIDIDEDLDFPAELLEQLKMDVLNMARYVLMTPQDRANDGANVNAGQMPAKVPAMPQEQQPQGQE